MRYLVLLLLPLGLLPLGTAQATQPEINTTIKKKPKQQPAVPRNDPVPSADRSQTADADQARGESSSRDTLIDLSPPAEERKKHPGAIDTQDEVSEFHSYDPHKAMKDVEVGDFYFKRKNYRAALDRYKDALLYKPNDAVATYKVAQTAEKMENFHLARESYSQYLKILPKGPEAENSKLALERLK